MLSTPAEERAHGKISLKTYYNFFRAGGNVVFIFFVLFVFIFAEVSIYTCTCIYVVSGAHQTKAWNIQLTHK